MAAKAIILRNYRSIGSVGSRLPLDHEFIGVLGVNNSGKSTVLRAFYELRPLFSVLGSLQTTSNFVSAFTPQGVRGVPVVNLVPGERIQPAANDWAKPSVTIELEKPDHAAANYLVELTVVLTSESDWRVTFKLDNGQVFDGVQTIGGINGPNGTTLFRASGSQSGIEAIFDWTIAEKQIRQLADSMYIGPFRNAINSGGANYYDLATGSSFVSDFNERLTGSDYKSNQAIHQMTTDLASIFGYSTLTINANPEKTALTVMADGISFRGNEQGAGLLQFIIVAANVLVRRPRILLIDEPELNLHADLQLGLLTLLASYVSGPIVFATHSLGLARSAADKLLVASKSNDGSVLQPYNAATNLSATLGELSYGGVSDQRTRAVLLVEGVTEVRLFREILSKYGVKNEVVIVPLGGDDVANSKRDVELSELRRLSENVYAIVDSERISATAEPATRRLGFASNCQKQKINVLILQRRASENYLDQPTARRVLKKEHASSFSEYAKPPADWAWNKESNWRVASAMNLDMFAGTDLDQFLKKMVSELYSS